MYKTAWKKHKCVTIPDIDKVQRGHPHNVPQSAYILWLTLIFWLHKRTHHQRAWPLMISDINVFWSYVCLPTWLNSLHETEFTKAVNYCSGYIMRAPIHIIIISHARLSTAHISTSWIYLVILSFWSSVNPLYIFIILSWSIIKTLIATDCNNTVWKQIGPIFHYQENCKHTDNRKGWEIKKGGGDYLNISIKT